MQIYEYPLKTKPNITDCVLALGFFDGVHIAHRDLLTSARRIADERGLSFGIFTFGSDGAIKKGAERLYDDGEKAELFDSLGADFCVYADFGEISGVSAEDFVNEILVGDLSCRVCVAGFNFRFGRGAIGNSDMLSALMKSKGGEAVIRDEITIDGATLSATLIRGLIAEGKIAEANRLLGSPYYIKGRVSHGRRDGGRMGFPTANLDIAPHKITPRMGVYRSVAVVDGEIYNAVTNIGVCPTFGGESVRLEGHLIDFDGDLYGKEVRIYLLEFLRDERRFDSVELLKMQITVDKNTTIKKNGDIKWHHLGLKSR